MTPERLGELLRRPQLLDGQNATELEELITDYPWCGPLRLLRYRKAVLDDAPDVAQWRARAGVFLAHAAVAAEARALQAANPARATTYFAFGEAPASPQSEDAVAATDAPTAPATMTAAEAPAAGAPLGHDDLHECTLSGAIGVDTAEWYLYRNGLIMEYGRPRPTPIENLASYRRWKRRRVRASWDDLLQLGIQAPAKPKGKGKPKAKKRKRGGRKADAAAATPEVASETLAELLADQGHTARAVEMYEQLRLRYPEKDASFVTRIAALQASAA